jgi:hypothetical protein
MNEPHNVCFWFAFWVLKAVIIKKTQSVKRRTGAGRPRALFPAGTRDFSLLRGNQTASGANSASYPVGTAGDYPGDKSTGA